MTATVLAWRGPEEIREALVRRGLDEAGADASARGLNPTTLVFDRLRSETRDALAASAMLRGIDCLTGDGWAVLQGSSARLAGLARSGAEAFPAPLAQQLARCLSGMAERSDRWVTARGHVTLGRPVVVGILNVTPDSFSDGGRYLDPSAAVERAADLIDAGAGMLDVGAESTRPGRPEPVPADEEWRRLAPVLRDLTRRYPGVPLCVDTVKSETAERALDAGAWAVNDVSGMRLDPQVAAVCAKYGAGLVLVHSRGPFDEMAGYEHAMYGDVTVEVARELAAAVNAADAAGVGRDRIVVDPGLGFSKTPEQTCEVLRGLPTVASLGMPVMVGPSRKRFLGAITGKPVLDRDPATAAVCVAAYVRGARLFRVHDVAVTKEALDVASAVVGT